MLDLPANIQEAAASKATAVVSERYESSEQNHRQHTNNYFLVSSQVTPTKSWLDIKKNVA